MKAFEIIIYAIAAIALVFVLYSIIMPFFSPESNFEKIKEAIQNAKITPNLGKTNYLGALNYPKGEIIFTNSFDKTEMLLGVECTNPQDCCPMKGQSKEECKKPIEWDNTFFAARQNKIIHTYARCTKTEGLYLCKIYLGASPAQAKIEKITSQGTTPFGGEKLSATIKNSGATLLAGGTSSLQLSKKISGEWIITDYLAQPQSTELLMPGETAQIEWEINPQNTGEYRSIIKFEAQNAGFDEKSFDFNKNANLLCTATEIGETLFEEESKKYREMHKCTGCNFAHECVAAWSQEQSEKTFYPETREEAYCFKNTYEGQC